MLQSIVGQGPIKAARQNHALEHATLSLILQRVGVHARVGGRPTASGFYVYGDLPTKVVEEAAHEALRRLKDGESELAFSPLCGTNLAVAGALAGVASWMVLGKKDKGWALPKVIVASTLAVLAAQPLGRLVQKHLTTETDVENVEIARISKSGAGRWTSHKIDTVMR